MPFDFVKVRGSRRDDPFPLFSPDASGGHIASCRGDRARWPARPEDQPDEPRGVLPWTHWRAFTVIGLLAIGNLFCMACPFTFVRDLGRKILPARLRWPRALSSKWLSVGLIVTLPVGVRGFRPLGQTRDHRFGHPRIFSRRPPCRRILSRRQLLQVRVSDRAVSFRAIARFALRGESPQSRGLRFVQDIRLHQGQRRATRMRASAFSTA